MDTTRFVVSDLVEDAGQYWIAREIDLPADSRRDSRIHKCSHAFVEVSHRPDVDLEQLRFTIEAIKLGDLARFYSGTCQKIIWIRANRSSADDASEYCLPDQVGRIPVIDELAGSQSLIVVRADEHIIEAGFARPFGSTDWLGIDG